MLGQCEIATLWIYVGSIEKVRKLIIEYDLVDIISGHGDYFRHRDHHKNLDAFDVVLEVSEKFY